MRRSAILLLSAVLLAVPAAAQARAFHVRVGHAFGLLPRRGMAVPTPPPGPLVYHGGGVMHGVTLHALYWAPPGYGFAGSPGAGAPGYTDLIDRFLADVAHDYAGSPSQNVFSLIAQYPDGFGAPTQRMVAAPAVHASDPFPRRRGCVSPAGSAQCVTDDAVEREIAARAGTATGPHQLWMVFLPPGVDECITATACATNAFAGYHSVFESSHGPIVYAVIPDPTLEYVPPPGSDPQGHPAAESAIDTLAHEVVEALTDPDGAGWMDPTGNEVGDRCTSGPQIGQPLGYAPNGSPYNQLIGGHQYLLQTMYSNRDRGCVLHSSAVASAQLPKIALIQWSPVVRGLDPAAQPGQRVTVKLMRSGAVAGSGQARIGSGGRFALTLRARRGRVVGVGDDRDVLEVGLPHRTVTINTAAGGNPFTQTGYTGWSELDGGFAVGNRSVQIAPCSQTGVLALRLGGRDQGAPVDQCSTTTDVATVPTPPLGRRSVLTLTSVDNRASTPDLPAGALVAMTVPLGEPNAASTLSGGSSTLQPTGAASCTADLSRDQVRCAGLVPGARYALGRHAVARADRSAGVARFSRLALRGGAVLPLRGAGGRVLTVLHVARLRVDLNGASSEIAGGTCEAGTYLGPPPALPASLLGLPSELAVLLQLGGSGGGVCDSGRAAGLPSDTLSDYDDRSGGSTETAVPGFTGTIPANDATLYGPFRALADVSLGSRPVRDPVTLTITRGGSRRPVLRVRGVNTPNGVPVAGLAPGAYRATWTVRDRNGDTRTIRTVFVEA